MISAATLHLVAELRAKGALFVVISGARLSTLLMRLPYLPTADAYVCENGGRILYPGSDLPTGTFVGALTHVVTRLSHPAIWVNRVPTDNAGWHVRLLGCTLHSKQGRTPI